MGAMAVARVLSDGHFGTVDCRAGASQDAEGELSASAGVVSSLPCQSWPHDNTSSCQLHRGASCWEDWLSAFNLDACSFFGGLSFPSTPSFRLLEVLFLFPCCCARIFKLPLTL